MHQEEEREGWGRSPPLRICRVSQNSTLKAAQHGEKRFPKIQDLEGRRKEAGGGSQVVQGFGTSYCVDLARGLQKSIYIYMIIYALDYIF